MVHISEVSHVYVSNIHEHLKENQTVKVKVIDITPEGKISLSIKKALPAQQQPQGKHLSADIRGTRNSTPNVWKKVSRPKRRTRPMSFEDMMDKFKKVRRRKNDKTLSISRTENAARIQEENKMYGRQVFVCLFLWS